MVGSCLKVLAGSQLIHMAMPRESSLEGV